MQVSVAHRPPNTAVLTLRGSLDIDTAPSLKANLNRLVERPSPRVVVDMSGLDFCDSMGVGVLVTAHGRAMERGGWVRLPAPAAGHAGADRLPVAAPRRRGRPQRVSGMTDCTERSEGQEGMPSQPGM